MKTTNIEIYYKNLRPAHLQRVNFIHYQVLLHGRWTLGSISEVEACERLRKANARPTEPYPGALSIPWGIECLICGTVFRRPLKKIADNEIAHGVCKRAFVAHRRNPDREFLPPILTNEQATERAEKTGWQPMTDFPGRAKAAWAMKCLRCGVVKTRSLYQVNRQARINSRYCNSCCQRFEHKQAAQIMIEAGVIPIEPYRNNMRPWLCVCLRCGNQVAPSRSNVQRGQGACLTCARRIQGTRQQLDEVLAREEMIRLGNVTPLRSAPYPGVDAGWPSTCNECGSLTSPSLSNVRKTLNGCRRCGNQRRISKYLESFHGEACAFMKANDLLPLESFPGVAKPWKCKCLTCGAEISPRMHNVQFGQGGCKRCAGQLDPRDATEIMRQHGFTPLVEFPGANAPWPCLCKKCGKEVRPRLSLVRVGTRCGNCFPGGFNRFVEGFIYLMEDPIREVFKIGITNTEALRVNQHETNGLQLLYLARLPGQLAWATEQAVLAWWRDELRLPFGLSQEEMPHGGFTETVSSAGISAADVWQFAKSVWTSLADSELLHDECSEMDLGAASLSQRLR